MHVLTVPKHWTVLRALLVICRIAVLMGGIEVALIVSTWHCQIKECGVANDSDGRAVSGSACCWSLETLLGHLGPSHSERHFRHLIFTDALGDLTSLTSVLFQHDWTSWAWSYTGQS
jgi:hypothetical protein